MKTTTPLAIVFALLFLITACGDSNEPDVRKAFTHYLDEHLPPWQVRQLKVITRENVGTEARPVYQVRYEATVYPAETLYQQRAHILNSHVLEPVQEKGERFNVHGIGELALYGGDWRSHFQFESGYPQNEGRPSAFFQPDYVVRGTSAYRDLLKRAQASVQSLRQGIAQENRALSEAQASLEQLRKDHATALDESAAQLAETQQATREQRRQLNEQHRQQLQKHNAQQRAERSEQEATLRQKHQSNMAAIEAAHGERVEAIRNERAAAQQQRKQRLDQALDKHRADISNARSSMEGDAFRAFNSEANTRLQNTRQSIETHYRNQLTPISEKEAAAREQRRDATQAATQQYREQLASLREQSNHANRAYQEESRSQYQQTLSEIDAELHNAQQAHRDLQAKGNERITQARNALQRQQQVLGNKQSQLLQINQQLAALEQ